MLKRKQFVSLLTLSALFMSCALGPNYRRPEVPKSPDWKWRDASNTGTKAVVSSWWLIFSDPVLNDLERRALENNYELKGAVARVIDARAKARVSRSDLMPSIKSGPSARWQQYSQESFQGQLSGPRRTINTYGVPLDLSYEVDLWGKVRRYFESSRALAQASQEEYEAAYLGLTADVAQYYFSLRTLDAEQSILERTAAFRQDSLDLNRSRYEAGLTSEIDVTRAQVELANTEIELAEVILSRAQMENALAVLLGVAPSEFSEATAPLDKTLTVPTIPPGLPSNILQRRPDVAKAEALLRSENAQVGVALASFFPVIHLTGTMGFESSDLANLFSWSGRAWSFGPSITIPIFEGGRNLANYKSAKSRYEVAVAQYQQSVLVAFKDVENALVDLRQKAVQAKSQKVGLDAAQTSVVLLHKRYDKGLSSYLEVIDAERSALQAERGTVQTLGDRLNSTIHLIKALGGGWGDLPAKTQTASLK